MAPLNADQRGEIISEIIHTPTEKLETRITEAGETVQSLIQKRDFCSASAGKPVELSPEDQAALETAQLLTNISQEVRILRSEGKHAPDVDLFEMYGGTNPLKPQALTAAM